MFPGHPQFPHKPFANSQPLRPGQPGYNPHQIHQHLQAGSLINAQKFEAMQSTTSFSSSSPTLASSAVRVLDDSVEPPPETSVNPRIIRGWADGMQARMANVNALAVVATFLAAVQAQMISFTYQNNSTAAQRAVNALSFLGLSFDVIGTAVGLFSALTMQPDQQRLSQALYESSEAYAEWVAISRELAELEQHDKMNSGRSIPQHMMQERMAEQRHFLQRSAILRERQKKWIQEDAVRTEELEELKRALIIGNIKGLAPLVLMALGIICFFIALLCFLIDTQPPVVWGTTLGAILLGASVLPVDALLHSSSTRTNLAKPLKTITRRMTGSGLNTRQASQNDAGPIPTSEPLESSLEDKEKQPPSL